MLEILGYLGCVYLFFKGVEIWAITQSSTKQENKWIRILKGAVPLVCCIGFAAFFALWINLQAGASGQSMR
jgi:hypothetical protein